jgi:hypothetical protein
MEVVLYNYWLVRGTGATELWSWTHKFPPGGLRGSGFTIGALVASGDLDSELFLIVLPVHDTL